MRSTWRSFAWLRATLVVVVLALYVVAALYPFDWQWPVARNAAVALPDGGLMFNGVGIARSEQVPRWVPAAIASGRLQIDLRVRPFASRQAGPARIVTLSPDPKSRNFTVGQDGDALILRLRTPWSTDNGTPAVLVPRVFATGTWVEVRIDVRPGQLKIDVGDTVHVRQRLPMTPLALWSPSHKLALGNELTGDRPWYGEIARAAVRVNQSVVDYAAPGMLEIPTWIWHFDVSRLVPFQDLWIGDAVLNLVGFVPLGILFGFLVRRRSRINPVVGWKPLGLVILVSAGLETLQVGFPDRNPSTDDLIFNGCGGAIGFFIADRIRRRHGDLVRRVVG